MRTGYRILRLAWLAASLSASMFLAALAGAQDFEGEGEFIDGEWVDPVEPQTLDVVNPATEEVYGRISIGSAADVDIAVARVAEVDDADRVLQRQLFEPFDQWRDARHRYHDVLVDLLRRDMAQGRRESLACLPQSGDLPNGETLFESQPKDLDPAHGVGSVRLRCAPLRLGGIDFHAVNSQLATAPFLRRAHSRGTEVFVWTINDPINVAVLSGKGVDGIITDYPDRLMEVLDRAEPR